MRVGRGQPSPTPAAAVATWLLIIAALFAAPGGWAAQQVDPALRAALKKAINDHDGFKNRYNAEVWLMDMSHRLKDRMPNPARRIRFLREVHYEAVRAHLRPEWVLAVIDVESNFKRFAISSTGAEGYMQVMPFWLKEIGHPEDNLFKLRTNLRMGCTILRYYLNKEHDNLVRALARYNGSIGSNQYPGKVLEVLEHRWFVQ